MRREIKFKVWIPYRNIMIVPKSIQHINEEVISGATIGQMKEWVYLQYIGLKDKNGKEIYEGDIVKIYRDGEESLHSIRYYDDIDYPAFDLDPQIDSESNGIQECLCALGFSLEVIGNIYQNPELLETWKH